eukprot:475063_1
MAQEAKEEAKPKGEDKICVIEDLLNKEFEPTHLEVINEAHTCDNMRIKVIIVSDKFKDVSTIDRHRNVQKALGDMMEKDIHAITIKAKTPVQWKRIQAKKQSK